MHLETKSVLIAHGARRPDSAIRAPHLTLTDNPHKLLPLSHSRNARYDPS